MGQHTPGPWIYKDGMIVAKHDPDGDFIAKLTWVSKNVGHEDKIKPYTNAKANARLITTAPTMHEYILYVENKIGINEIPFTFEEWKQAEIDLAE